MKKTGTTKSLVRKAEAEASRPREKPKSGWEVTIRWIVMQLTLKGLVQCFPTGIPQNHRVSKTSSLVSREIV